MTKKDSKTNSAEAANSAANGSDTNTKKALPLKSGVKAGATFTTTSKTRGRPLRAGVDAAAVLAPVVGKAGDWSTASLDDSPSRVGPHASSRKDAVRAARWLEAAREEHASVAAFAKLSLDLLAHRAPADLAIRSHKAAIDEIHHARASFAMAKRFGAGSGEGDPGPGPLAIPTLETSTLRDLARITFRDGCVGEAEATLEMRRTAESTDDPVERDVLIRMANDEERHAELAWAVVTWAASLDAAVLRDVEEELDAAPRDLRHGILEPGLRALFEGVDRQPSCAPDTTPKAAASVARAKTSATKVLSLKSGLRAGATFTVTSKTRGRPLRARADAVSVLAPVVVGGGDWCAVLPEGGKSQGVVRKAMKRPASRRPR
jgi:hypothetical protein